VGGTDHANTEWRVTSGFGGTIDNDPIVFEGVADELLIDEDDMASDSDTKAPTQQSVKAYVDASIAASQRYDPNIALLALELADLKGDRLGMVGGIADPFDDEG